MVHALTNLLLWVLPRDVRVIQFGSRLLPALRPQLHSSAWLLSRPCQWKSAIGVIGSKQFPWSIYYTTLVILLLCRIPVLEHYTLLLHILTDYADYKHYVLPTQISCYTAYINTPIIVYLLYLMVFLCTNAVSIFEYWFCVRLRLVKHLITAVTLLA